MKAKNKKLTYSATILALAALSTESAFAACTPGGTAATSGQTFPTATTVNCTGVITGGDPLIKDNNLRYYLNKNGDLNITANSLDFGNYDLYGGPAPNSDPGFNSIFTGSGIKANNTRPNAGAAPSPANRQGNGIIHIVSWSSGGDASLDIDSSSITTIYGQGLAAHAVNDTGNATLTVKNTNVTLEGDGGTTPLGNALISFTGGKPGSTTASTGTAKLTLTGSTITKKAVPSTDPNAAVYLTGGSTDFQQTGGNVESTSTAGVGVRSATGTLNATQNSGTISGGTTGLLAINASASATSVTVAGTVTGGTDSGIQTSTPAGASPTITLNSGANVSASSDVAIKDGSGNSTVTLNGG